MENIEELREKVHAANVLLHDYFAETHNRNVPYMHRRVTRKYVWNLIKKICNNRNKTI